VTIIQSKDLGKWYGGPDQPIGDGCQIMRMDKALIMHLFKHLLVPMHGNKLKLRGETHACIYDVESIEDHLRVKMRDAKRKTNKIVYCRQKRQDIVLFPESYQCIWLLRLMQTSKFFRAYVIMFRETTCYLFANNSRMQMALTAEKKHAIAFRIATIKNTAESMIKTIVKHMVKENKGYMLYLLGSYQTYGHRWVCKLSNKYDGVSLLDIWNHGNRKAFKMLANELRVAINRVIEGKYEAKPALKFINACPDCTYAIGSTSCERLCNLTCVVEIGYDSYGYDSDDSDENGDYWH
jgi:hypothetical protein